MNDLTSFKFGEKILSKVFTDISVYNYYESWDGKYADSRGISLVCYDGKTDLSANIKYLTHKNSIIFNIEDNDSCCLHKAIEFREIREYHYDYFIEIIKFYFKSSKEFRKMILSFTEGKIPQSYIRSEQINKIL